MASGIYIDTSALGRVLSNETMAGAIVAALVAFDRRVSSRLLGIELRRLGARTGRSARAEALLADVALVTLDDDVLGRADRIEPHTVATLDAIHLATAVRLAEAGDVDAVLTYDKQFIVGARHHGIDVITPAATPS